MEAVRKSTGKRSVTMFHVPNDKAAQAAIDDALASVSKTAEGQEAAQAAIEGLMSHPDVQNNRVEVTKEKPRYGGIFNGRALKMDA